MPPSKPIQPKRAEDLRFEFTPIAPGGNVAGTGNNWTGNPARRAQPTQATTIPQAIDRRWLSPMQFQGQQRNAPPAIPDYQRRVPGWYNAGSDRLELDEQGMMNVLRPDGTGETIDPGAFGKDWWIESKVENGRRYQRYVVRQQEMARSQPGRTPVTGLPGEQQFGLAPGDPNTTLRGGLAEVMGSPVGKGAQAILGGALPGAVVGSAILPGIGTIAGGIGGAALNLLQQQENYDQNSIAGRLGGGLAGAAIGSALLPGIGTAAGGLIGLLAGPQVLDAGRDALERTIGFGEQAIGAIAEPEKYGWTSTTLGDRINEMRAAWEAARNTYEASPLDVRALSPTGWGKYDLMGNPESVFVDWDLPEQRGGLAALVEARRRIAAGEDANIVYGDMAARFGAPGQLRELGSGFVLDPLNVVGEVQKAVGVPLVAKLTGDQMLAAANKLPGRGLVDTLQHYKQMLLNEAQFRDGFNAQQDMNRLQRLVVGEDLIRLAERGTYEKPKWWELWKLTPESAARDRVVQSDAYLQAHLAQLPADESIGRRAQALLQTLKSGDAGEWARALPGSAGMNDAERAARTIEGRIIRNHLDSEGADDLAKVWESTAPERAAVKTLADRLGVSEAEAVKTIRGLRDEGGGLNEAGVRDLIAKAGPDWKIGQTPVDEAGLKSLAKIFEDEAVPVTPEHFKAALLAQQIEASGKWAAKQFGIKPPPFLERVAAAAKAAQSTVLLGLNPTYVVNNIINGEVTMAARGVWGLRGLVEARDELAKMGLSPARLSDGGTVIDAERFNFNPKDLVGRGQAAAQQAIGEAREYTGTLADVQRGARKLSEHLPATMIAPKVEQAQSLRAFYQGFKEMWSQTWKAGKAIPEMPLELVAKLEAIDPRLPQMIYGAAEAGLTPADIGKAIFESAPRRSVQAALPGAAQAIGMSAEDAARVLAVDGLDTKLNEALASAGENPGKIRQAFERVQAEAEQHVNEASKAAAQEAGDYAAQAAQAGDVGEVLGLMDEVEMRLYETHQGHMQALEQEWERINRTKHQGLKTALIESQKRRAGEMWQGYFDYEDAVTKGMADGLKAGGFELHENFNTASRAKRSLIDKFHQAKNKLLSEFFELADRTDEDWQRVTQEINRQYAQLTRDLDAITAGVDAYMAAEFARRYNEATGAAVATWRDTLRGLRRADMDQMLEFRQMVSRVKGATEKDRLWKELHAKRTQSLQEIERQAIGLRRKVAEVMNVVKTTDNGPQTTGVPGAIAEEMGRKTFRENAGEASRQEAKAQSEPVRIGEQELPGEAAQAVASAAAREVAVEEAAQNLGRVVDEALTPNPSPTGRGGYAEPERMPETGLPAEVWGQAQVIEGRGPRDVVTPRDALREILQQFVRRGTRHGGKEIKTEQLDATMALVDARAEVWARQTGLPVEEYIPRHFAFDDEGLVDWSLWQRGGRARQVAAGQADMFAAGSPVENADMPLFSGTAAGAVESPFVAREVGRQEMMPGFDNRPEFGGGMRAEGGGLNEAGPLFEQAQRVPAEDSAGAVAELSKPIDQRAPWAMTRNEWETARERNRPDVAQRNFTKGSASEAQSRIKELERLLYGVRDEAKRIMRDAEASIEQKQAAYESLQYPITHREIVAKAIKDGQPVPRSVLDEFYNPLKQETATTAKGATTFLEDGRAVLRALRSPDVSTAAHELGHVFRRDLAEVARLGGPGAQQAGADLQEAASWVAQQAIELSQRAERGELKPAQRAAFDFAEGNNWIDAIDDEGDFTRAGEEIFARGFERYLAEGVAPSEGLRRVFENFKTWLAKIYKRVKGSPIEVEMSAEMRGVFDRLLAESEGMRDEGGGLNVVRGNDVALPTVPVVENPQTMLRHELPGTLSQSVEEMANVMIGELSAGEPGKRIFTGDGEIIGQASTYPDWYKEFSAKYGAKKQQVFNALDKIVRDQGADTGLTVERVKELLLNKLADGWDDPIGGRVPGDPEAAQLLGRSLDEVRAKALEWQAAKAPSPLTPLPQGEGRPLRFYQSAEADGTPGMTVETPGGKTVTVTGIGEKTITIEENGVKREVPIAKTADAPLPPGVLADMGARPMPVAAALRESYDATLRPVLGALEQAVLGEAERGPLRGVANAPEDVVAGVQSWLNDVNGRMGAAKLNAMKWGEYKRDSALLNYSRKYKYNQYLQMVAPYEFFMTQSMIKWALHSIDRPWWLAQYYRTSKFLNTSVSKAGFPSRLAGQIKIPMPWLPEWMGDGIFVDPFRSAVPFESWAAPWEQEQQREARLDSRAEAMLNDQLAMITEQGTGTAEDVAALSEALKTKSGSTWEAAKAKAVEDDPSLGADALDTAMTILPPSLPLAAAINALRGKPEKINNLPVTRYTRALSAVLGVGGPGGINLEAGIRRQMGLPVLDEWADYRIDRELANMAGDGSITADQAKEAMISRSGPVFDRAVQREAQASGFSTIAGLGFGGGVGIYPEGERNQRLLGELKKAAYEAEMNGDTGALAKFFEEHPEYEARAALGKDPETRLRNFLVDKVWNAWNDMPRVYRQDVQQSLGWEFQQAFLNKDTRSYESVPMETLARWARTVGAQVPGRPETKPLPVEWSDPQTVAQVEDYYRQRETLFNWPAVRDLQSAYYEIPYDERVTYQTGEVYKSGKNKGKPKTASVSQRDLFLRENPELGQYLDWRKDFLKQNPNVQGYLDEQKILMGDEQKPSSQPSPFGGGATAAKWSPEVTRVVQAAVFNGRKMSPLMKSQLQKEWQSSRQGMTFDQWLTWRLATGG